ncbi:MAG: hypothetical protein J7M26_01095 [Armatimonadetes bacterium]|nr:hypothetical protein [Armatimonadota bacterium]
MEDSGHIYGYQFRIIVEKSEAGWIASCPGVGGVYEEGATAKEAVHNAEVAGRAILEARMKAGDAPIHDNEYLKVIREIPQNILDLVTDDEGWWYCFMIEPLKPEEKGT